MKDNNDIALWSWHRGLNGIGIGANRGGKTLSPSIRSKLDFLWTGLYNGDNLLSDLSTDVITVTGKDWSTSYIPEASTATFAVPNNATYIANDTDLMWFDSANTPKTIAIKQLVNFDYERTIIKYNDEVPHNIYAIAILKAGETLTTDELDNLHAYFKLWYYWSGVLNDFGHSKDNRVIDDVPEVATAIIPSGQSTKVAITFDQNIDEDTIPATTDFTLTGSVTGAKTISGISISGAVVTLTVSVAFGDETATLSYTQPIDNALRSALGGGKVASIVSAAITNNLYGPELIVNGGFDTDTVWNKYTAAELSITGGVGVMTAAPSGRYFSQVIAVENGATYKVKYIVSFGSGATRMLLGGVYTTARSTSGTFTENVVTINATSGVWIYAYGATTCTVDNISVKKVL